MSGLIFIASLLLPDVSQLVDVVVQTVNKGQEQHHLTAGITISHYLQRPYLAPSRPAQWILLKLTLSLLVSGMRSLEKFQVWSQLPCHYSQVRPAQGHLAVHNNCSRV